jgi:integrase
MAETTKVTEPYTQDRTDPEKYPHAKKPYVLHWKVGGRPKSRAFEGKKQRKAFADRLNRARLAGELFDTETGEPVSWASPAEVPPAEPSAAAEQPTTVFALAVEHIHAMWSTWAGTARRSPVETATITVLALLDPKAPRLKPEEREAAAQYLRCVALAPPAWVKDDDGGLVEPALTAGQARAKVYLQRWSLPVDAVRAAQAEAALSSLYAKQGKWSAKEQHRVGAGGEVVRSVRSRRRNEFHALFGRALRHELITVHPLKLVDPTRMKGASTGRTREIDLGQVQSLPQGLAFIEAVRARNPRVAAYFAAQLLGGFRPSEGSGLFEPDVDMPEVGWGLVRIWGGTTVPGRRYSNSGEQWDDGGQKWREADEPAREVPIPPLLVAELRAHRDTFGLGPGGRFFVNSRGNPLTPNNTGKVWREVREELYPTRVDDAGTPLPRRYQDPLHRTEPYDLRHTNASMLLDAGMKPKEVARRLGHSLTVLMEIYAGLFADDEEEGNAKVDVYMEQRVGR